LTALCERLIADDSIPMVAKLVEIAYYVYVGLFGLGLLICLTLAWYEAKRLAQERSSTEISA
jgi:hypothetical protein